MWCEVLSRPSIFAFKNLLSLNNVVKIKMHFHYQFFLHTMHIRFGFSFSSIYLEIDNFFIPLNSLVYELLMSHPYWMSLVDLKTIILQLKFGTLILDTHLHKIPSSMLPKLYPQIELKGGLVNVWVSVLWEELHKFNKYWWVAFHTTFHLLWSDSIVSSSKEI